MVTMKRSGTALHLRAAEENALVPVGTLVPVEDWGDEMYDVYVNATDVINNHLPTNVANATVLYIMDWSKMSSDVQAQLQSQVYMYDAENREWLPQ